MFLGILHKNDEIGLWGIDFKFFDEYKGGEIREVCSDYPFLLKLMKLWPGYWYIELERMSIKVDKNNGRVTDMSRGRIR